MHMDFFTRLNAGTIKQDSTDFPGLKSRTVCSLVKMGLSWKLITKNSYNVLIYLEIKKCTSASSMGERRNNDGN
jgi:hypothetical protein